MSLVNEMVLQVGAEGGDVTLVGRRVPDGAWQFARVTEDQTEALFGAGGEAILAESAWVDGWEAGLELMDRYPWAMLYPLTVHPGFVDRVRVAVEERLLKQEPQPHVGRVRDKWERVLGEAVASKAGR